MHNLKRESYYLWISFYNHAIAFFFQRGNGAFFIATKSKNVAVFQDASFDIASKEDIDCHKNAYWMNVLPLQFGNW